MGNQLVRPVRASELAVQLGLPWRGVDVEITRVDPLNAVAPGSLCFSKDVRSTGTLGPAVLIAPHDSGHDGGALIEASNPRLVFAKALNSIEAQVGFAPPAGPAQISASARVSPHAFVGRGVRIGERTVIAHFAVITDGVQIGDDCYIKSCAVVGEEGFGFERDLDGTPVRLVHLGTVRIGNRVEVGSLTTVCRGTLADTVIEDDAKIDDHVHIAHNCKIRRGAMVVACAEVSGGVELGEYSWVGPNASIIQQKKIGPWGLVGIGSNVIRDVAERSTVAGNPAKPLAPKES